MVAGHVKTFKMRRNPVHIYDSQIPYDLNGLKLQ